jgi:hypothetical protein
MQTLSMTHNRPRLTSQENKNCASVRRSFNDVKQSLTTGLNTFVNTEGTTFRPVRALFHVGRVYRLTSHIV